MKGQEGFQTMQNSEKSKKYLQEVKVSDETLAEHDAKHHPEGYKEGDKCNKRAGMEKIDPVDTDIRKETKAEGEAVKPKMTREEWTNTWRKYLRSIRIEKLAEHLHQYDDDHHEPLMKLILEERDRREQIAAEQAMTDLGERA